jgi:phage-related protein
MIFVVEHEKGGPWQLQVLENVEEINTKDFEPVRKIFFCETMDEAQVVVNEIIHQRFK